MGRDITDGKWFDINSEADFKQIQSYGTLTKKDWGSARVCKGDYAGPGKYLLLQYTQRCPHNCCYDDVNELLSAAEVAKEIEEGRQEFALLLDAAVGEGRTSEIEVTAVESNTIITSLKKVGKAVIDDDVDLKAIHSIARKLEEKYPGILDHHDCEWMLSDPT